MKAFEPHLVELPDREMLTVTTTGDPNSLGDTAFSSLFGTAYATKFKVYKPRGQKATFGKLCALWPDAHLKQKSEWTGIWGLPVPDFFEEKDLLQKDPGNPVHMDIWSGGTYAQILHIGSYSEEAPTVEKLHRFIEDQGLEMKDVPGTHEEEYLTSPDAKVVKTVIRYRIK
jgi:hypothetical protein